MNRLNVRIPHLLVFLLARTTSRRHFLSPVLLAIRQNLKERVCQRTLQFSR